MQSEGKRPPGTPKKYPNAVKAYSIIIKYAPAACCKHSGTMPAS